MHFGNLAYGTNDDPDGDGLTNAEEFQYATKPNSADSDYDWLPDGWEIAHQFNPNEYVNGNTTDTDGDGLMNYEEYRLGFDPRSTDSDTDGLADSLEDRDGDGLFDVWELRNFDHPTDGNAASDHDSDGLTNLQEQQLGTLPYNPDTDDDGMPDGWEQSSQLNPTLATDSALDADGDGISNHAEYQLGFNPRSSDSDGDGLADALEDRDGDGLPDAWEWNFFASAAGAIPSADDDGDSLTNLQEYQASTNPKRQDTDGDLLPDGWEILHGLDPLDDTGDSGADGDLDGDLVSNADEYLHNSSPTATDTDEDGTDDATEIAQGSDPADDGDGGAAPEDEVQELVFRVGGDYASWNMIVMGTGPNDHRTFNVVSPKYGEWKETGLKLQKRNSYEITLRHTGSRPQDDPPWYCWEARVAGLPPTSPNPNTTADDFFVVGSHWLADNSQGLLAPHTHSQGVNLVAGRVATLRPVEVKIERSSPTVLEPQNNYSENTKIKVTAVWPAGSPNAGQPLTGATIIVTLGEEDTEYFSSEATEPVGNGFFDATGQQRLEQNRLTTSSQTGWAECIAKSLSVAGGLPVGNRRKPRDAKIIPVSTSLTAGTNSLSVEQWVDNTSLNRAASTNSSNRTIDWVEARAWDIYRNTPANTELGEVLSSVTTVTDDSDSGTAETQVGTGIVNFDPFVPFFRLDSGDAETEHIFRNTAIHEARHAWQNMICRRTGLGYSHDDDDGLPPIISDDPDNDDDWNGNPFGDDGDYLPEAIYQFGDPALPEWPSAVSDESPIKDDNDNSIKPYSSVYDDFREPDAQQFGNEND